MKKNKKVIVLGAQGLVGSALIRRLKSEHNLEVIGYDRISADCLDVEKLRSVISFEKPDWVIVAAAKVGGVLANSNYPVDFLMQNLQIQNNIFSTCFEHNVERLLFLSSSCVYPAAADGIIMERDFLNGKLHNSVQAYALAKIAGMEMVRSYNNQHKTDYRCVVPCNIYGPRDSYDEQNSHVIPALILKFHNAKQTGQKNVEVWGDGTARREFLYVDDLADACLIAVSADKEVFEKNCSENGYFMNVSPKMDVSISELAEAIKQVTNFAGEIVYNADKPAGVGRKLLDNEKLINMGWQPNTDLISGLRQTYENFKDEM